MVGMKHSARWPIEDLEVELTSALRAAGCVYAEEEAAILVQAAGSRTELASMLAQRIRGFPLEHLVGWAEFCGMRIIVAPGVFVPRRRSEFLVHQALAGIAGHAGMAGLAGSVGSAGSGELAGRIRQGRPLKILDLCCGSGAVGAALAHELHGCELHAADLDPAALSCAAKNIAAYHGEVYCGDLFDPLPETLRGSLDVIVANAPYVPTDAIRFMPQEARMHEPTAALDGGVDGLDLQRGIAVQAPLWLRAEGLLLLEISARQAESSAALLIAHGFAASVSHSEYFDSTVVTGRLELLGGL